MSILTQDKAARKAMPIARGVLDYFPRALAAIANVSYVANEQHNPGEPMHWAKEKSTDHADCILRHLIERGTFDDDNLRHSAKMAWRALALLETELEAEDAKSKMLLTAEERKTETVEPPLVKPNRPLLGGCWDGGCGTKMDDPGPVLDPSDGPATEVALSSVFSNKPIVDTDAEGNTIDRTYDGHWNDNQPHHKHWYILDGRVYLIDNHAPDREPGPLGPPSRFTSHHRDLIADGRWFRADTYGNPLDGKPRPPRQEGSSCRGGSCQ